ncbi:MAG: thioredoxin [Clostridia bacterium]
MTELTKDNFKDEVLNSEKPVLVDFFATWCGPCRMLAPTVEDIAADYGEKIKVVKADVDLMPEISMEYGIMSIPTLMLFKGGQAAGRMVGLSDYDEIAAMIDDNL